MTGTPRKRTPTQQFKSILYRIADAQGGCRIALVNVNLDRVQMATCGPRDSQR